MFPFSLIPGETLFGITVRSILSSGTGEFNEVDVYGKTAADYGLEVEKARCIVTVQAKARVGQAVIDAVKEIEEGNKRVMRCINDVLACDKVLCSDKPLVSEIKEEHRDLLDIYMKTNPPPEKVLRVRYLLGDQ